MKKFFIIAAFVLLPIRIFAQEGTFAPSNFDLRYKGYKEGSAWRQGVTSQPNFNKLIQEGRVFSYPETGSSQAWMVFRPNTTNADANKTIYIKFTGYGASNPIKVYGVSTVSQAVTGLTETGITFRNLLMGSSNVCYLSGYTTDTFANHTGITATTQLAQTGNQISLGDDMVVALPSNITYLQYYVDIGAVQRYLNVVTWTEAK